MSIDIGKAAFSGFGLIGRHPLSVLVWGLLYVIVLGVPLYFVFTNMLPMQIHMMHDMAAAQAAGETPMQAQAAMWQSMAGMQQMSGLIGLANLLGLAVRGVLIAAVLRAVLEPEKKGFFYLRFGMEEVWQALLSVAMGIVLAAILVAAILVCAIIVVIAAMVIHKGAIIVGVLLGLFVLVAFIVIMLRLSLAPAMTFHDKTFRLFESWKLTKGHAGALFAIVLILMVLVWVLEVIIGGIFFGVIMSNGDMLRSLAPSGVHPDPSVFVQNYMSHMTPFIIGAAAIGSIFSGALMAIFLAPFATAYKQLTAGAAAPATA